jgi:hypothetical protein
VSEYPTWGQRKSWNNDGMDPDWRPPELTKCAKCEEWLGKYDKATLDLEIANEKLTRLESDLQTAVEALEEVAGGLKISEWSAASETVSERILVTPGTEKARAALEKIKRGGE